MGKYSGYLICSDIDGTIYNSKRELTERTIRAINNFKNEGGLFTIASGRYPKFINEFTGSVEPNTYVVACNGAVLYDNKEEKVVLSEHLQSDIFPLLEYIYNEVKTINIVCISSDTYEINQYSIGFDGLNEDAKKYYGDMKIVSTLEEIKAICDDINEPITRLVVVQGEEYVLENCRKLEEKFGDKFDFIVCWDMGFEIIPKGSGKGQMIQKMKKLIPEVKCTIGIGDYGNDISMFEYCDIGYAVANAPDWVKAKAKNITVSNDEDAVAQIIENLKPLE